MRRISLLVAIVAVAGLGGCGAGTAQPFIAVIPPTASPSALTLNAAGQKQTVTVSEGGYSGTFGAVSSNASVATVSPTSGAANFTVTAVGGGTATITFADSKGGTVTVSVSVTTSGLVVNARPG